MSASRLLEAPIPFAGNDAVSSVFSRGRWPVCWLRFPTVAPGVVAYRLRVDTKALTSVLLQVSAGERYRFFLDGMEMGNGPERGDAEHWRMDAYLLDLAAGSHWLAFEVWCLGLQAPCWQVPVLPGLLVIAEGRWGSTLSTGHGAWEACPLSAVSFRSQPMAFFTGPRALVDGSRYPWGWTTGAGSGFASAESDDRGVYGGRMGADLGFPRMVPATIPRPEHALLPNGTAVFVDQVSETDESPPVLPVANLLAELPAWQNWLEGRGALRLPAGESRRCLVDLGTYRVAWPELLAAGHEGKVRLRFAEGLYRELPETPFSKNAKLHRSEWKNGWMRGLGPDFSLARTTRIFRAYEWECGRWLEIAMTAGPGAPLVLERLSLRDTSFPFVDEGSFACDFPALETVRAMCSHTLRVGTHGHYCDCPYYERLQYLGDTRLEVLATYCLTADNRLPARALEDFAGARLANGLVPARHPARGTQIIGPFALWWIGMLHDAAFWRNEPERLRRLLPVSRGILDAVWAHRNADGLIGSLPGWNFVDWVPEWEAGMPPGADDGVCSIVNWQTVAALRQAADLEATFGEPALAALQLQRAGELTAAIDASCWDDVRGLYLDSPGLPGASEHAQVMAILAGLNGLRRERVIKALTSASDLARTTIYFTHYLFEAYYKIGAGTLLWQRLQLWFDLPSLGLTTTPEQPEPTRSDCHPWGAHPLYHIAASLVGLRPSAPGFSKIVLSPLLDIPLCRLSLTLPHPRGQIRVELTRPTTADTWAGHLAITSGIEVDVSEGVRIDYNP